MKKTILTSLIICFATAMNAQVISDFTSTLKIDTNQLAQSYLQKSKSQKTAAWILLSVGAVATTVGIIIFANEFEVLPDGNNPPLDDPATAILATAGTVAMLTSIPLFIASKKNKRKAHLYLNSHHAMLGPRTQVGRIYSIGVQVQL